MKVLILDNYDSFTYNLVHILREMDNVELDIFRNDKIAIEEVEKYDKILISPGPGIPEEAGILKAVVETYGATKSILGVCLGHQGIAEVYGCELFNMPEVLHGIAGDITVSKTDDYMFKGVPTKFKGCHYHSWAVVPDSVSDQIQVTATDEKGNIMALSHVKYDVKGLQFHPESILTENGKVMLENWIKN
ncbi:aminodeoxychorismate/anthranilate synthase component II [Fulvivirga maritima]|uniref:anthranilate synthase component II n=1 Tax=Fulvivirga maritima TaxID=2904247 RepID=UPI001F32D533|nr:aminodeoxychorismate/anthranilate synthase component II [Fulvivirga maritima]UII26679.1 aminodeoxychorismate/anthranilate synthase component II [Fulvivirga maritima]